MDTSFNEKKSKNLDLIPLFVWPKDDELLSSWIVRLAIEHRLTPLAFTRSIFSSDNIWNRDVDYGLHPQNEKILKKITPIKSIDHLTFSRYSGVLFDGKGVPSFSPFIMQLGVYHRKRFRHSTLYCPSCLKNDKIPYYRIEWRLATSICCIKCGCFLEDRCPTCQFPIAPHRVKIGRIEPHEVDHTECWQCGTNLSSAAIKKSDTRSIEIQKYMFSLMNGGTKTAFPLPLQFFQGLRAILSILLRRSERNRKFTYNLCNELGLNEPSVAVQRPFESQNFVTRRVLLHVAFYLLEDWPYRFIRKALENRMYSSFLKKDLNFLPYWYEREINWYLFNDGTKSLV